MPGPERATFLERFVTAFRIPFYFGCLLLALIFGPPGAILTAYLQTNDLHEAVARTVYLFVGMQVPVWQGVFGLGILSVLLFYLLYMIRYMRLKLVAAEPLLLPILPEGEATFHRVFGRVSRLGPPIVLCLILIVPFSLQAAPEIPGNFIVFGTAPANLAFLVVSYPLWFVIFSTFTWVYFSSIRGLHELGRESLKLKSFQEDRMLGVRPIGSLSLSFAFTYFTGLGILVLLPIIMSPNPSSPGYIGLLSMLILLGVVFFFIPLNTIHKKMLEVKHREEDALRKQIIKSVQKPNESQISESTLSETRELMSRLTTILSIDITKKEVAAIPTWPFDAPILGRLAAMIFSIIAILIANFILQLIRSWL